MITLPELEEDRLVADIEAYESEQTMPYVTNAERVGIQKGTRAALLQTLEIRFGPLKDEVSECVEQLDQEQLDELFPHSIQAKSLADFCKHLPEEAAAVG